MSAAALIALLSAVIGLLTLAGLGIGLVRRVKSLARTVADAGERITAAAEPQASEQAARANVR